MAWQPSSDQLQQFTHLQELLREWNSKVNLTRLVEGEDYWISQIFDSLWPLKPWLSQGEGGPLKVIDVGTGGGFPGLAMAIALPQAQLTLVDSVGRKVQAVQAMAEALGIRPRAAALRTGGENGARPPMPPPIPTGRGPRCCCGPGGRRIPGAAAKR